MTRMPWQRVAVALVALLFLNGALSFRDWWPTPGVLPDARLAPEFVGLWVLLMVVVAARGVVSRAVLRLLAAIYFVLVIARYADVTAQSLFGRELNLYWDIPQVPRFLWVSLREQPWWLSGVATTLALLLLWGLYRLLA